MNISHKVSYQSLILRQLNEYGYIDIPSSGYSMFPCIRQGDVCQFRPIVNESLSIGDILLFLSEDGKLIGHRLIRLVGMDGKMSYECKGDTNHYPDAIVKRDRILGKLTAIQRLTGKGKSKTIHSHQWLFQAWGGLMIRMPFLSRGLRRIAQLLIASSVPHEQRQ